jgi:hypothetical protein
MPPGVIVITNRVAQAVAGLTGWLLRIVFVLSVAASVFGVYLAWFASLGRPGPVHDRLTGTVVMAEALGVSLAAFVLLTVLPKVRLTVRKAWYLMAYLLFAALFLTTALPLSAALRLIGDWQRSNTQVVATVYNCYETRSTDNDATDYCTFDWTVNLQQHEQTRQTNGVYPDETNIPIWVDPNTGGADDHGVGFIGLAFIGVFVGLIIDALVSVGIIVISKESKRPRAWLADMAWWRVPAPSGAASSKPDTALRTPEIADAIPAWVQPGQIEDARPPGYD